MAKGRLPWPALIFRHALTESQLDVTRNFTLVGAMTIAYISPHGVNGRHPVRRPFVQALHPSRREECAMDEGRFSISAQALDARLYARFDGTP